MSAEQQTEGRHLLGWVVLLAIAQTVAVTAAAAAVLLGSSATTDHHARTLLPMAVVAVAGLVAGGVVGRATARLLHPRAADLPVRRWFNDTAMIATVGWVAVAVSSARAGADVGAVPGDTGRWLLTAAALGLALLVGAGLGWTSSAPLRHRASFPFRWVGAAALTWAPAAAFGLGVTTAGGAWPPGTVLGLAAGTGVVTGGLLALTLGWYAPLLTGPATLSRALLAVRGSRRLRFMVPRGVIGLRVQGARTGTWYSLPVMAAWEGPALIVRPGRSDQKRWWRNLIRPSRVQLLRGDTWEPAEAWVIGDQDISYPQSLTAYRRQFPRVDVPTGACLVRIIPTALVGPRPTPARR